MARLFNYGTNPPTRISTGLPASSLEAALREECDNIHGIADSLDDDAVRGPINVRKMERPILPMPWRFVTKPHKNVTDRTVIGSPGGEVSVATSDYFYGGSEMVDWGESEADNGRYQILEALELPNLPSPSKVSLYFGGGTVFLGAPARLVTTSVGSERPGADPDVESDYRVVVYWAPDKAYREPRRAGISATVSDELAFKVTDLVPLTVEVKPVSGVRRTQRSMFVIGDEHVMGSGLIRLPEKGHVLVVAKLRDIYDDVASFPDYGSRDDKKGTLLCSNGVIDFWAELSNI